MAIFKNLSSLRPCGVSLSVVPPAQKQFAVLEESRKHICPWAKSLCFQWAIHNVCQIEMMHLIA